MNFSWVIENRASLILYNILKSIKPDYTFIIPANICPIVPATFLKAKVKFIFVDISLETLCIDLSLVRNAIVALENPGFLYVRNMGIEHDVNEEFSSLKELNKNLIIIDDRCQSKITFDVNDFCKSADVTLFSTGYAKYLDLGFGGLGYINTDKIEYIESTLYFCEDDLVSLTNSFRRSIQSQTTFNYCDSNWLNSEKIPLLFEDYKDLILKKNKEIQIHKEKINRIYSKYIDERNIPKYTFDLKTWRFNIFCYNKDEVLEQLFARGYFASSHYPTRSHLFGGERAQNSDLVHKKLINLFNNEKISEEMAFEISNIINQIAK